jgi:hypothetical protein
MAGPGGGGDRLGAALTPLGLLRLPVPVLACFAVGGLLYAPYPALSATLFQRESPPELLSQVLAARGALTVLATPLGTALGGPLTAWLGAQHTLLASAAATTATGLAATALLTTRRCPRRGSRTARTSRGCDNRHMPERLEVQRAVAASAGEIFAVLTDPRGHVAIDSSGMLMEASGDIVARAGDTFVVHMDREALGDYPLGLYDVTVEIVTFERDQEIAWTVHGQLDLGHVYGYRLEPIEEGTLVTSYYDWSAAEQNWKDAGIFPVIPESALRATLGILARTVAPGKPRPASST